MADFIYWTVVSLRSFISRHFESCALNLCHVHVTTQNKNGDKGELEVLRSLCTSTSKAFSCKIYLRSNEFPNKDIKLQYQSEYKYSNSFSHNPILLPDFSFRARAELIDLTVKNLTLIWETLCSNTGLVTSYCVWAYSWFSSVPYSKFWGSTSIWSRRQYFKFLRIQQSGVFLTFHATLFSHWLSVCSLLHVGFLLDLLFKLEDGSDIFLRNVGCYS